VTDPGNGASPRWRWLRPVSDGPFARYSRFVGVMKVVLPALAVVLLGLVMAWPNLMLEKSGFQVGFARLPSKEVDTLAMRNAQYYGIDQSNHPYAVSADLAVQDRDASGDLVHLDQPLADFTTSAGANVVVGAKKGLYRKAEQSLLLTGDVTLYHDSGAEIHTNSAIVDLVHGTVRGSEPVNGHGPQGQIAAAGFEVTDKGKNLIFTGKSQMILRMAERESPRRAAPR